jgi:energy-coupling factor transport system substrate-specific component
MMNKKSLWSFGTREVVFSAIGAALYAVLSYGTNLLQIPGAANVSIRPAVAIPLFFGVAFGPIVGFITGILGNMLNDFLSGNGFWIWWDIGNGLMGLVPGLVYPMMQTFRSGADIFKAELTVIGGSFVGMFFAAVTEIWVSGITFGNTLVINFVPAFLTNIINGLIVVPILMLAYSAVVTRSGR